MSRLLKLYTGQVCTDAKKKSGGCPDVYELRVRVRVKRE